MSVSSLVAPRLSERSLQVTMSSLCVNRRSYGLLLGPVSRLLSQARRSLSRSDVSHSQFKLLENKKEELILEEVINDRFSSKSPRLKVEAVREYSTRRYLSHATTTTRPILNMTNKPRFIMPISTLIKSSHRGLHPNGKDPNGGTVTTNANRVDSQHKQASSISNIPYALASNPHFTTMASIQKMAIEPTREHIDNIRESMRHTNAKDNDDQQVTLEKDQETGIAYMCIKSAAKNGISAKMMCDFLDAIDELYAWPEGKGLLIYGHNGFFCSGGDLVSVRELANYEDGFRMATLMQYNMSRLQALPMITMSLIQGKALGGGAEIAATTDLRVITKSGKFGYVHCRVGIVAAWGGGSRLVQLVGPSRAVELMSSGRQVGAEEALLMGLVNSLIDDTSLNDHEVVEEAKSYLKSHIIGDKSTIVGIKALVNAARTLPLEQALVVEGQILSSTWGKPPHLEALNNNIRHRDE